MFCFLNFGLLSCIVILISFQFKTWRLLIKYTKNNNDNMSYELKPLVCDRYFNGCSKSFDLRQNIHDNFHSFLFSSTVHIFFFLSVSHSFSLCLLHLPNSTYSQLLDCLWKYNQNTQTSACNTFEATTIRRRQIFSDHVYMMIRWHQCICAKFQSKISFIPGLIL